MRGLSPLQKQILIMAYQRKGHEKREARLEKELKRDVTYWKMENHQHMKAKIERYNSEIDVTAADVFDEVFHVRDTAARVSVSRSFSRLEARGLVNRWPDGGYFVYPLYSGISLTQKGREQAKELMVNMVT